MSQDRVLSKAVIGQQTLLNTAGLILGGSLFVALAAQVSVPMYPVPMTLQTLAILIVGLTYGARLGALTLLAYLAEGAMGLPVFAGGGNGASLVGPTAGFLFGFVPMAYLAGLAAEKGLARGLIGTTVAGAVVTLLVFVPGVAWLSTFIGFETAVQVGMLPFLVGMVVKSAIAAMVVRGGWKAVEARRAKG